MSRVFLSLLLLALSGPVFASQNLLDTYGQALHSDPELASAQAALGVANARYRQARGQMLPQLSVSAGYTRVTRDQTYGDESSGDRSSIALNLNQALFNWSAWQQMDAAEARNRRAHVLLSAAEQALVVRTTDAYFEILSARDALIATRERQAAIRRQLDRARAAFEAGLASITDKQEAQSSLDAARVDAISAKNRLAIARQQLRALTGQAPRRLAGIAVHEPTTLGGKTRRSRQDWWLLAKKKAPSLAAARAALTAARQQIAAARGQRYPDVALVGSVGRNEQLLPRGVAGEVANMTESWSIGLQMEMPLFAGGSINAAVDEAIYTAEQVRLDLVSARRQLRLDVASAWRSVAAAEDRVAALDQAIKSAKTAVEAARAGYRLGNRTILDVIEAETELVQRKAERKQAWYDYAMARLKLRQASGILDYAALARINRRLAPPDQHTDGTPAGS